MNNLYHKVAFASVCTALSFTLGANKEAKAATFTLNAATQFAVEGDSYRGVGERLFEDRFDTPLEKIGNFSGTTDPTETRAFSEFNIGNLSLAPNTIIRRASFKAGILSVNFFYRYLFLEVFGYVGNGEPNLSDFESGVPLDVENVVTPYPFPRPRSFETINFDVTRFVNARVSNRDAFAGFGIRIEDFYANYGRATLIAPRLEIEAEPVPEPTTIFGSAIGLCLGGWIKRKNSSRQDKTAPQR